MGWMHKLPGPLRTYKTEKFIRVDVPRVGVFFRVCQFLAFLLVLAQLYINDGWALSEVPGGIYNAWDEAGTMLASTNDVVAKRAVTAYCSNASYSYSSEGYSYDAPVCEGLLPAEITAKTPASVFYTTAYLETVTRGWPCAAGDAAARQAGCEAGGGIHFTRIYGQCGCVTQRAVYPLAVEEMGLALEHAFDTTIIGLSASSAERVEEGESDPNAMYSLVHFGNGTSQRFEAGQVVRLPLADWLRAANVTLWEKNENVSPDPTGAFPPMRTTGVNVKVSIVYTNADPQSRRAVPGKTQVHADISLSAEAGTWTGVGVETFWVQYPSLPRDVPQEYHLVECARTPPPHPRVPARSLALTPPPPSLLAFCPIGPCLVRSSCCSLVPCPVRADPTVDSSRLTLVRRKWKQGVLFNFATSGNIYQFDFFYLLQVVIGGLVLLKVTRPSHDLA